MRAARRALLSLAFLLGLVALVPGAIYGIGLLKVDGWPNPADPAAFDGHTLIKAWEGCRESSPVTVERLNPWGIMAQFLLEDPLRTRPGQRAAWRIASAHNLDHPVGGNLWWHTSGAALTVWVTRNWSADQINATIARDGLCK